MFYSSFKEDKNHEISRIYPHFIKKGNVEETIFHFKVKSRKGHPYAEPLTQHLNRDAYTDYEISNVLNKIAGTEFVAKKLATIRRKSSDEGAKKNARKNLQQFAIELRSLTTNEGTGQAAKSMAVMVLPPAYEDLNWEDFDVNRDTDFYKFKLEKVESSIYGGFGVPRQLIGNTEAKAALGGNTLKDLYGMFYEDTVRPRQNMMSDFYLDVSNAICDILGYKEFKNTRYLFSNKIEMIRSQLSDMPITNFQKAQDGNQGN